MTVLTALSATLFAPLAFGTASMVLFGRNAVRSIPGLLFHSVTTKKYFPLSSLSPGHFNSIVYAIKENNFTVVTLKEAWHARATGTPGSCAWPSPRPLFLTFDDGCESFYTQALPLLETLQFKATLFPVAGFIGKSSSWDVLPSFPHVTKSELLEISSLGHEIGSHGLTHSNLTYLNKSDLTTELNDSKKALEDILGKEVTALSFPYGCWNNRVWERAQEIGYRYGTVYRKQHTAYHDLFPVFGVYKFDTPHNVLSRITGRYPLSLSLSCARMMSHFAKGSSMWKFNEKYSLFHRKR
jgi:peptidoglycan/xylan/chitin deacetylase (PgdA/CDA1 family)